MADYYTPQQVDLALGITEGELANLEVKGLLQPAVKNGRRFYSSRQVYLLRAALQVARKGKLTLEEAFTQVASRRLYKVSARGD